mmetsp:Transcript_16002/g.31278  ORF Transcript_16002/g.31278 Transcript_16002/m.31278 type:complete len:256 (+) Transcript_16002:164-931(+)
MPANEADIRHLRQTETLSKEDLYQLIKDIGTQAGCVKSYAWREKISPSIASVTIWARFSSDREASDFVRFLRDKQSNPAQMVFVTRFGGKLLVAKLLRVKKSSSSIRCEAKSCNSERKFNRAVYELQLEARHDGEIQKPQLASVVSRVGEVLRTRCTHLRSASVGRDQYIKDYARNQQEIHQNWRSDSKQGISTVLTAFEFGASDRVMPLPHVINLIRDAIPTCNMNSIDHLGQAQGRSGATVIYFALKMKNFCA